MTDYKPQAGLDDYATDESDEDGTDQTDDLSARAEARNDVPVEYYNDDTDHPPRLKKGGNNPTVFVEEGPNRGNRVGEVVDILGPDGPGTDPDRPDKALLKQVNGDVHRVREVGDVGGYAISTAPFKRAVAHGARLVVVSDTYHDTVYEWPIERFRRNLGGIISTPEPQKYGVIEDASVWEGYTSDLLAPRGTTVREDASESGFSKASSLRESGGDT